MKPLDLGSHLHPELGIHVRQRFVEQKQVRITNDGPSHRHALMLAARYTAFKIKVGHPDFERDLLRLHLLRKSMPKGSLVMIDPNEAWNSKEALMKLAAIRNVGHDLPWVEDPILRHDFEGLRTLRRAVNWTRINSGEYLDLPESGSCWTTMALISLTSTDR